MKTQNEKPSKYKWIKMGLIWGLIMYIVIIIIEPLSVGEAITLKSVLLGIPIWGIFGIGFEYAMIFIVMKKK